MSPGYGALDESAQHQESTFAQDESEGMGFWRADFLTKIWNFDELPILDMSDIFGWLYTPIGSTVVW